MTKVTERIMKMNAGTRHHFDQLCWSNIQIYLRIQNQVKLNSLMMFILKIKFQNSVSTCIKNICPLSILLLVSICIWWNRKFVVQSARANDLAFQKFSPPLRSANFFFMGLHFVQQTFCSTKFYSVASRVSVFKMPSRRIKPNMSAFK